MDDITLIFVSNMESEQASGPQLDGDRLACVGQDLAEIPAELQEVRMLLCCMDIRTCDAYASQDGFLYMFSH